MDATRAFSISSNGSDSSKAIEFNTSLRGNHVNGATLSSEKILQLCSARSSALSRLNETFISKNAEAQSLLMNANGHNLQSPTLPLPPAQSPASFSNFPRFPHPSTIDETNTSSRFNVPGLNNTQVLQPRLNPVSRRTRHFVPNESKDEYYWQKRRKNNEAARKSREKRRTIDSVLEEKVLILSHENKLLRNELYALKVKYGEIKPDSSQEISEAKQEEKVPIKTVVPPSPSISAPPKRPASPCGCASSKSPPVTSPTIATHTAITLPKVNVILESDKLSNDSSSSAKFVLSNLASGTLILSPINLSKAKVADVQVAIENGSSSTTPVAATNGSKPEELKEVEAANALASLFRCSGGSILAGSVADSKLQNGHSSESSDSSSKDYKTSQNLPCKLRFKSGKLE